MSSSKSQVVEQSHENPDWRKYSVREKIFEVPRTYQLLQFIGEGAFGTVCSAVHLSRKPGEPERVAVKQIAIQHDNILEVRRLVRELYLMDHFRHDNVVGLYDLWPLSTRNVFDHIYLTQELMDADLHAIIRSRQALTPQHVKFLLYQILRSLKAIHSAGVLHRDLKPSNILVNSNCDLKLGDFGLARESDESAPMTVYVATRWYRAPELLMQHDGYGPAVDLWAAGCIFAEMMTRRPLLMGTNYLDQLNLIIALLGKPAVSDLFGVPRALEYVKTKVPDTKGKDFKQLFPGQEPAAMDLLEKLLRFNPEKRPTAAEALAHPYFEGLHDPTDEPDAPHFDLSMPEDLTMPQLKRMLFDKITQYNPSMAGMWDPAHDVNMIKGIDAAAAADDTR
eukprot:TRINITY_DN45934_c0_g1_i1.p1 TRINITY_DN45934_c0_g1~~TRINITY_DN45934_c0_g1_i1.p1  ORF type:complete len:393 (+),score=80.59 TRINITY_DN45934_c0_g1_i1:130-1308(+)